MARKAKNLSTDTFSSSASSEVNGASTSNKEAIQSLLDKLTGNRNSTGYETREDYEAAINNMTLAELQSHAIEFAEILPIDDRDRLINNLVKEFCKKLGRVTASQSIIRQNQAAQSRANNKEIEKTLANLLR